MVVGGLTGLDGSGFSGLPLTGALARTFGTATGSSVPVMAALGQIAAIFVGGGTIVPWGLIPVAAICNVSPLELARKNLIPVCIGFACTFALACFYALTPNTFPHHDRRNKLCAELPVFITLMTIT